VIILQVMIPRYGIEA